MLILMGVKVRVCSCHYLIFLGLTNRPHVSDRSSAGDPDAAVDLLLCMKAEAHHFHTGDTDFIVEELQTDPELVSLICLLSHSTTLREEVRMFLIILLNICCFSALI